MFALVISLSLVRVVTLSAAPPMRFVLAEVGDEVIRRELVSPLTVRLAGIDGGLGDGRPQHVDLVSDSFEVIGVDASTVAAEMGDFLSIGYWPDAELVGVSVPVVLSPSVRYRELSIPCWGE